MENNPDASNAPIASPSQPVASARRASASRWSRVCRWQVDVLTNWAAICLVLAIAAGVAAGVALGREGTPAPFAFALVVLAISLADDFFNLPTLLRLTAQLGTRNDAGQIELPFTRQELAEMSGTTLFTVSRTLSEWERRGLVETGRERVTIRIPHELVKLAEEFDK